MAADLRVFLSSTSLDLAVVRDAVMKVLGVLESDLIAMEMFGSDEAAPKQVSLERVRQCNLFIGIYAERYGTVDAEGLSITELEYHTAHEMLERGHLIALLPYMTSPKAKWPIEQVDRDPVAYTKLQDLKKLIRSRHTVASFDDVVELPLDILRDVLRKVGVGRTEGLRPRLGPTIRPVRSLDRPVGMEFYTEELAPFFVGREEATDRLVQHLVANRVGVLLAPSGAGKTSLIRAGLFPAARAVGWRCALARPLSSPLANVRSAWWGQLMQGQVPEGLDLATTARTIAAAHDPAHVLLVIDQFEDILNPDAHGERNHLAAALTDLHASQPDNLRLLLSYRTDVEGQLGEVWQVISGSSEGLPRFYLRPLSKAGAREALRTNLTALGRVPGEPRFYEDLAESLSAESYAVGVEDVYPPLCTDGYLVSRSA